MNKRFTIVLLLILFTWVFVPAAWCGKDTIKLDSFVEMVFESNQDFFPLTGRQQRWLIGEMASTTLLFVHPCTSASGQELIYLVCDVFIKSLLIRQILPYLSKVVVPFFLFAGHLHNYESLG